MMKNIIFVSVIITAMSLSFTANSQVSSSKSDVPVAVEEASQTPSPDTAVSEESASADEESAKHEDTSDEPEDTAKKKKKETKEPCEKCRDKRWNW